MYQLRFTLFIFKTNFHAVTLKSFEIADGAYLQPFLLCSTEYFKIVGKRRSKAHIAAAKTKNTIRQFKSSQKGFHMAYHFFQCVIALIRMNQLHDFNFIKLMNTV